MLERIEPNQQREIFGDLLRVWLIYVPWGWLLAVLYAPAWVIFIFIVLIWSSTAFDSDANGRISFNPPKLYGCFLVLIMLIFFPLTMLVFVEGMRLLDAASKFGDWVSVPGATLITCHILGLLQIFLRQFFYGVAPVILRYLWLISLLLMYYWILCLPTLFQNLSLPLPPGEKWNLDWSTVVVIWSIFIKILYSVSTLDTILASFVSWYSSFSCIMLPAYRNLLQVIPAFKTATVLTFVGVAGLGSGWFIGKFMLS